MSYMTMIETAESFSLQRRVQAAAAQEARLANVTIQNLAGWVSDRMLELASTGGWGDKWQYAKDTYQPQFNPDLGARPDVISDGDILAAVQPLIQAMNPPDAPSA